MHKLSAFWAEIRLTGKKIQVCFSKSLDISGCTNSFWYKATLVKTFLVSLYKSMGNFEF